MAGLLDALFQNESGGRNIANTTQGTSSGQAQGYFQITEGTWNEFGGNKYAVDPLHASYEQQAEIAAKIPLKRWDPSTLAVMRATGKPIDPNRTLGENLAANGESLAGTPRISGPVEAAGGGAGSDMAAPQLYAPPAVSAAPAAAPAANPYLNDFSMGRSSGLADTLSSSVDGARRRLSGERSGSSPAPLDESGTALPTLDYQTAAPEAVGQPKPLDLTPLAELFKIKDIGQAAKLDPVTQQPVLSRTRTLG